MKNLRVALRSLVKSPGFTLVAALTFALGIGANVTIYSFVSQLLLRPLPFPEAESLVAVWGRVSNGAKEAVSLPDFLDWQKQSTVFTGISAGFRRAMALTGKDEPVRLLAGRVSPGYADVLGVAPLTGRWFNADEDKPGGSRVVVLSEALWQTRFYRQPDILGKSLTLDGQPCTVIGVMPRHFQVAAKCDIWVPLALDPAKSHRRSDFLYVVARLQPGTTMARAQAEMDTITGRLTKEYPDTNTGYGTQLIPLQTDLVGSVRMPLLVLWGAVGLVLLIACANISNLLIARSCARARDYSIRLALGASRGSLLRDQLRECWLLGALGGGLGLLGAGLAVARLNSVLPLDALVTQPVTLDLSTFAFAIGLAFGASTLAGLAPAWLTSRLNLHDSLKSAGHGATAGGHRQRLRAILVVAELGLAVALLVGAGLMLRSFNKLLHEDPGYNPHGILTATVSLPATAYPKPADQAAFQKRVLERLAALPSVGSVALTNVPYLGGGNYLSIVIQGRSPLPPGQGIDAMFYTVSPEFHRTLGIRLKQGRFFTAQDHEKAPHVMVVNETFVRRYFPHENPVGARINFLDDNNPDWYEIIGVVNDVKQEDLTQPSYPEANICSLQNPISRLNFILRTEGNPAALASPLRAALRELDPGLPPYNVLTAEERLHENLGRTRVVTGLLALFATVAVTLSALGVYGVIAFLVAQRQRELGIRLALGAAPARLVALVMREGITLVALGTAAGLGLAAALTGLLRSQLYALSPFDPYTFATVPLVLGLTALLACAVPARRAAQVDPMVALRAE